MTSKRTPRTVQPAHKSDKVTVAQARKTWNKILNKDAPTPRKTETAANGAVKTKNGAIGGKTSLRSR